MPVQRKWFDEIGNFEEKTTHTHTQEKLYHLYLVRNRNLLSKDQKTAK